MVHQHCLEKKFGNKNNPELNLIEDTANLHIQDSIQFMFWSCSTLTQFWWLMFDTLATILPYPPQPSPQSAIFGVFPADAHLNSTEADLLVHTMMAGSDHVATKQRFFVNNRKKSKTHQL